MKKLVFEGPAEWDVEDSGMARIITLASEKDDLTGDEDEGVFVRVQSWSDTAQHPFLDSAKDKRLRVTVEILDDSA